MFRTHCIYLDLLILKVYICFKRNWKTTTDTFKNQVETVFLSENLIITFKTQILVGELQTHWITELLWIYEKTNLNLWSYWSIYKHTNRNEKPGRTDTVASPISLSKLDTIATAIRRIYIFFWVGKGKVLHKVLSKKYVLHRLRISS